MDFSSSGPKAGSYSPAGTGLSRLSSKIGFVIFTRLLLLNSSSVKKLNATASTEFVAPCRKIKRTKTKTKITEQVQILRNSDKLW